MNSIPRHFIGVLFILVGAVCYSGKAILVKLAYRYNIDAASLLALRMIFALPFYLAMAFFTGNNKRSVSLTVQDWIKVALFGLSGYYFASIFDFEGLKYITASLERLILFTYPTLVVVITAVFYRKKISIIQLIALLMTYAGLLFTFSNDLSLSENKNFFTGATLIFLASLTYAIYLVGSDSLIPKLGTVRYTAYAMIFAAGGVLIHFYITVDAPDLLNYHANIYWLTFLMATMATVVPSLLISKGIQFMGSGNASIIASIGPVSTIILSYFILGEPFTIIQMIGTLFVLAGVGLISSKGEKVQ